MTIKVLYVGGVGRSGSSLVERLLDKHPKIISLGEIHQIFSHWIHFDKRQLCGCGEQFQDCTFWNKVMERAFGSMDEFDPVEWRARRAQVLGDDRRRELLLGHGTPEYFEELDSFLEPISALYKAIAEASGASVIVDSSKTALWACALQRIPGLEVHFLHFVRNPYATAYSWQRKKAMPEVWWEERMMPTFEAGDIGKRWRATYITSRVAARRFSAYKRVHYEDFIKAPQDQLRSILDFAGLDDLPEGEGVTAGRASISPGHTVMGNPMRVQRDIVLREDTEWRDGLSPADHDAVRRYVWPMRPFFRG